MLSEGIDALCVGHQCLDSYLERQKVMTRSSRQRCKTSMLEPSIVLLFGTVMIYLAQGQFELHEVASYYLK